MIVISQHIHKNFNIAVPAPRGDKQRKPPLFSFHMVPKVQEDLHSSVQAALALEDSWLDALLLEKLQEHLVEALLFYQNHLAGDAYTLVPEVIEKI